MSEQLQVNYVLKSREEQLNEMARRVLAGVPGETAEHARFVANEIDDAINEINQTQREFLEGKHPNRLNWLTSRLSAIAKKHEIKEEALYGAVLDSLNKRQTAGIRAVVKEAQPVEDIHLNGWMPKDNYERMEAKETIGSLMDSVSDLESGAVCEGVMQEKESQGLSMGLVEQAMDSPLLSEAETALKRQVAVENYIAMRNDKSFTGSPMAGAIQTSVNSVEQMKKLYVMQKAYQQAYDEATSWREGEPVTDDERDKQGEAAQKEAGSKMDKYCKEGFTVTLGILIKRICEHPFEWIGTRIASIPGSIVLDWTLIGPFFREVFEVDLYAYNRKACGWIMKQARHLLGAPIRTMAEKVYPTVKKAAIAAAKKTVEVAKEVAGGIRKVGSAVCSGIKTVAKAVTTTVSSAWSSVKSTVSNVASGVKTFLGKLFS